MYSGPTCSHNDVGHCLYSVHLKVGVYYISSILHQSTQQNGEGMEILCTDCSPHRSKHTNKIILVALPQTVVIGHLVEFTSLNCSCSSNPCHGIVSCISSMNIDTPTIDNLSSISV